MSYDYKNAKNRIVNILSSKTVIKSATNIPKNDEDFSYENGVRAWVGAIFIDIVNSTKYFTSNKDEIIARIMRAFCNECIIILKNNDIYRDIGIRGDCVYAIYSVTSKNDLEKIFLDAIMINTFIKMYKKILRNNNMPDFDIGIGLGASEDLIIKAGCKGTGINDNIWIGSAVIDASNLSSLTGRNGNKSIAMDSTFYNNIYDFYANENNKYQVYAYKKYNYEKQDYDYYFDMINVNFDNWINNGMI